MGAPLQPPRAVPYTRTVSDDGLPRCSLSCTVPATQTSFGLEINKLKLIAIYQTDIRPAWLGMLLSAAEPLIKRCRAHQPTHYHTLYCSARHIPAPYLVIAAIVRRSKGPRAPLRPTLHGRSLIRPCPLPRLHPSRSRRRCRRREPLPSIASLTTSPPLLAWRHRGHPKAAQAHGTAATRGCPAAAPHTAGADGDAACRTASNPACCCSTTGSSPIHGCYQQQHIRQDVVTVIVVSSCSSSSPTSGTGRRSDTSRHGAASGASGRGGCCWCGRC